MRVVHIRAADSHELRQTKQVLDVVARLPLAHGDLSGNFFCAGRPQVNRVVRRRDVNQSLDRGLVCTLRDELYDLGQVATSYGLPHIQVLERLLYLRASHFEGNTPGARLCMKAQV